ncbi:MAG: glycerophosphodiester phosphodiesterase family protein [Eubacteriales bacterium]|nr:glycerophosphodiester phosphodiesterase family protein [Eubacteriales bacterium]
MSDEIKKIDETLETPNEPEVKKEKKKLSKKAKKIIIIVVSVVVFLLVAAVVAGVCVLNSYCKTKDYTVVATTDDVTLVAHRGMRSVAPENTTASFTEAGKHGYWGAECDVYRTKDGVWVISHDRHTYRMMDKSAFVEKKTYDELMAMKVDNGVNIDKYKDLKMCSLEDYLKICQKYKMTPVIELKGKNNTEHYNEIADLVNQYKIDVVYISFQLENLNAMRNLDTSSKMYYLVQKISEKDIEDARSILDCGIDFNGNKEANFKNDILKKCRDQGLDLGAWTINDPEVMKKLEDNGVTLITTDSIEYKK